MPDKTFLVLLKPPNGSFRHVIAARTKRRGDHLAFVDANGQLVASFLMDLVESWVEFMSLEEVMWVLNSAESNSQNKNVHKSERDPHDPRRGPGPGSA